MNRIKALTRLQGSDQLIENHRAWTARAFCMATAEPRGSFEPEQLSTRERRSGEPRRASRRPMAVCQFNLNCDYVGSDSDAHAR